MKKYVYFLISFWLVLPNITLAQTDEFCWLYLYYTNSFGNRPAFTILFNDKETLQLEKRARFKCKIYSTGTVRISCFYRIQNEKQDRGSVTLHLEHGKTYYVKLDNDWLNLKIVDEITGEKEFNKQGLSDVQNFVEDSHNPLIKVEEKSIPQITKQEEKSNLNEDGNLIKAEQYSTDPQVLQTVQPIVAGKYYALIIGNNSYSDQNIQSLDEPVNDAIKLYNVLTSLYTFDVSNVIILKNATYEQIIKALDDLSSKLTDNDNLLIFYAGHGWWDDEKKLGYWLPCDAKKSNTAFWIRNSTISDYMGSIRSKHTLLIADACFSGSIFKTRKAFADAPMGINKLYAIPSKKAMTSGNLKVVPDHSIFLQYLVKQLTENSDKYLSSDMLFSSFRQAVLNNSSTEPQYGTIQNAGDEGGEFIFIKR